ncbi:hypothetical protein C2845_PM01G37730 [Panicum miliaceum]|uniref:Uncharacterized protein n=1 Tax=Panicum miliaceum TaxID=4540 RepID=A0A3L6TUC7_PANMI|nr:hypothetical protein C2845_PM01G37730 [Panicum miliaceum]
MKIDKLINSVQALVIISIFIGVLVFFRGGACPQQRYRPVGVRTRSPRRSGTWSRRRPRGRPRGLRPPPPPPPRAHPSAREPALRLCRLPAERDEPGAGLVPLPHHVREHRHGATASAAALYAAADRSAFFFSSCPSAMNTQPPTAAHAKKDHRGAVMSAPALLEEGRRGSRVEWPRSAAAGGAQEDERKEEGERETQVLLDSFVQNYRSVE